MSKEKIILPPNQITQQYPDNVTQLLTQNDFDFEFPFHFEMGEKQNTKMTRKTSQPIPIIRSSKNTKNVKEEGVEKEQFQVGSYKTSQDNPNSLENLREYFKNQKKLDDPKKDINLSGENSETINNNYLELEFDFE